MNTLAGTLRLNASGEVNWFESMTDNTHIGGAILMIKSDRRWRLRQMTQPLTSEEGAMEDYILPVPTQSSGYASYDILTTKSPVTVDQGGTGGNGMVYKGAKTSSDNLDNIHESGYWYCTDSNYPGSVPEPGTWGYIINYHFTGINFDYQIYVVLSGGVSARYERRYNAGSWSGWKKLTYT
jgi:hypothetical protein